MPIVLDLEWTQGLLGFLSDLARTGTDQRGRAYAEGGRVRNITISEDGREIRASVQGNATRPYLSVLKLEGDEYLDTQCSCPVGYDCKHTYALALTLLGRAYTSGSEFASLIKRYLPAAWRNYAWRPRPGVFDGVEALYAKISPEESLRRAEQLAVEAQPEPATPESAPATLAPTRGKAKGKIKPSAAVAPPAPAAPPKPWWERLMAAKSDQVRQKCLVEAYEERVGPTRYSYPYDFLQQFQGVSNGAVILVRLEDAFEKLASNTYYGPRAIKPPDPRYLEYVASEAVQSAYREYQQNLFRGYLKGWIEQAAPAAAREAQNCTLELEWRLMPTEWGIPLLTFELLITTAKMDRRPRKPQALMQLYRDLVNHTRVTSPVMRELVEWMATNFGVISRYEHNRQPWVEQGMIPVHSVLAWIGAWGSRGILRWENGAPVGYDPRPARLVIDRLEGGRDVWAVEYPPPAGSAEAGEVRPLAGVEVFFDDSSQSIQPYGGGFSAKQFYARQGATIHPLDAAGMDLSAMAAARALEAAPLELLLARPQGMRLVRRLVRARPRPESETRPGEALVETAAVTPVIELKALRDNWISVAAYARSTEGHVFLRDPEGEWIPVPAGEDARHWAVESPFGASIGGETMEALGAADPGAPAEAASDAAPPAAETTQPVLLEAPPESANGAQAQARPERPHLVLPRPEDLAPAEQWLERLIPSHTAPLALGQERFVYQWPATPDMVGSLLRRWSERPPGPLYLGNNEFLKLITPAQRPSLKISVEPSGMDWLQVSVEMESELQNLTARELRELLAASADALIRLPNGRLYEREGLESYERELAAIEEAGLAPGRKDQRLHALHLAGEAGKGLIELGGSDERLAELGRAARKLVEDFKGVPKAPVAAATAEWLRPYQRQGADFLVWACQTFGGALLADDMGLGKTLQVLAALTALRRGEKKRKPSLVICPASVAHNWQREARRFAPGLKVLVMERGAQRKALWERFGEFDLVIKNYALTRRDAEAVRKQDWLMICVDEAQAIKNAGSEIAGVVKSLPAKYRIALTGTPIENRLGDLVSIMEFATPGFLPPLEGSDQALLARRLRAFLRPVLLRRLKAEVAPELPERIEERIDCAMSENQRLAYLAEVKRTREMLKEMKGPKVVGAARIQILAALTRLRQLCCDPALLQLKGMPSGKVEELMNLLPEILEEGHKVLLFSQFVRMLNRLHDRLKKEGIKTWMLTGQTQHRQELVDSFEQDSTPGVFLISLKAGGTGLNLVSASHVILFDPWWNPAVEAQAIDRTHRIGQDKTVLAFRLVTQGTIEERIMELQEKKRELVRGVLEEDSFNRMLTREDFEFLLQ